MLPPIGNLFPRPFLRHDITQNLYKGVYGESVVFEEVNHDLQLVFRYRWETSAKYGFVRTSTLENLSKKAQRVEFVDGNSKHPTTRSWKRDATALQ